MTSLRTVRGTRDYLPDDSRLLRLVEQRAAECAARAGFGELISPIFEFTEVFARTLGDTSDVVAKEMYTFSDRGGDSLTLRPENTAGIVRAVITNGLLMRLPQRVFYRGPMFRYERPQKGRLRQFHQVGVELFGITDPLGDVEVMVLARDVLDALGLGESATLELNTLGNAESRARYRQQLVDYLEARRDALSADSQARLERNPLRVLDSKDEGDRAVIADAPLLADALDEASATFFAQVKDGLERAGLAYVVNPRLVRGLDYYCHTTFEFTTSALGAQGTILAGGRYDGLVAQMGGSATPGTGWAAGVERLMMLMQDQANAPRPMVVIPLDREQAGVALDVARRLRARGHCVQFGFGAVGKQMKWANRINARYAIILGSDELARGTASVRDMDGGTQEEVPLMALEDRFSGSA